MTAQTKPKVRPKAGDVAYVPVATPLGNPFFGIYGVDFDEAGEVIGYYLSESPKAEPVFVPAARVFAVLVNILTPSQE